MPANFDRVRPRAAAPAAVPPVRVGGDADGKRALFSPSASSAPALGSVTLACSRCGQRSVLGLRQALRAAVPSVHLPLLRAYPSWVRCPACQRHSWVRPRLNL